MSDDPADKVIRRYEDDPTLTWEERYRRLEAHHVEETTILVARLRRATSRGIDEAIADVEKFYDELRARDVRTRVHASASVGSDEDAVATLIERLRELPR